MHFRTIILTAAAVLALTACGEKPIHDTSEKQNTHQSDLKEAQSAKEGSTKILSGKYKTEGTQNTFYVIDKDKLSIVESGTYEFPSEGSVTIQYGNNSPVTYKVEENEQGFNLTVEEQSILLPLEYMEGTDGLMKSKLFDGVYGVVNNGPGYVFHADGIIEVVTTHDAEVTKDTITFGGLTYGWRMKNGKVEFLDTSTTSTDDKKSDSKKDDKKKDDKKKDSKKSKKKKEVVAITMVPTDGKN